MSGESVSIPCSATGIPSPQVQFAKNTGSPFLAVDEKRIVYIDQKFGIQNLKIEDSGLYTCIAKSEAGVAKTTIKISVTGP